MRYMIAFAVGALLAYSFEVQADTLILPNGQNVDFDSFTYNSTSGVLRVSGSTGQPEPEPEPEPGTGACTDANIKCTYNIGDWRAHSGLTIVVPKGITLSSRFVASTDRGRFDMVPSPYSGYPVYSFWVSDEPGGNTFTSRSGATASSAQCGLVTSNLAFDLLWVTFDTSGRYCELQAGGTYYVNLRHGNSDVGNSEIVRRLK